MNRRTVAVALLPLAASLLPACSGAAPDGSGGAPTSPSPAGAAPAAIASRIARTLKIGQSSPVLVQAMPEASCTLRRPEGDESKDVMTFDADDDGYVEFYVRPDGPAPTVTFLLDCKDPSGAAATYAVDVSSDDRGDGVAATRVAPSTSTTRPALEGDLDAPSQGDLVSRGYPRRPDAQKEPAAYAQWRAIVTRPYAVVGPRHVEHPERMRPAVQHSASTELAPGAGPQTSGGPGFNEANATAGTWSGAVMTNPWRRYWIVNANWTVPNLYTPPTPYGNFVPADAAEWIGLDGWNGGSLVQAGSDSNTETYDFFGNPFTVTQYGVWIQNPPTSPWFIPNMPTSPHDGITVNVFLADANGTTWYTNGDLDSRDNSVWFMVVNTTKNSQYWGTLPRPASWIGNSAEFIIERGQPYNNATPVLADFEFQGMWNAEVGDTVWGSQWLYNGAPPPFGTLNQVSMVNGNDTEDAAFVYGSVANGDPGSIFWVWENK